MGKAHGGINGTMKHKWIPDYKGATKIIFKKITSSIIKQLVRQIKTTAKYVGICEESIKLSQILES